MSKKDMLQLLQITNPMRKFQLEKLMVKHLKKQEIQIQMLLVSMVILRTPHLLLLSEISILKVSFNVLLHNKTQSVLQLDFLAEEKFLSAQHLLLWKIQDYSEISQKELSLSLAMVFLHRRPLNQSEITMMAQHSSEHPVQMSQSYTPTIKNSNLENVNSI